MHLKEEINLKDEIDRFKESTKPKYPVKKEKKTLTFENELRVLKRKQKVPNGFESKNFQKNIHKELESQYQVLNKCFKD